MVIPHCGGDCQVARDFMDIIKGVCGYGAVGIGAGFLVGGIGKYIGVIAGKATDLAVRAVQPR